MSEPDTFVDPGSTKRAADRLRRAETTVDPGSTKRAADRLRRAETATRSRPARLVQLSEHHLDDVLAIEEASSPAGWTRKVFQAELARPESRCYLVLESPAPRSVVAFGGVQVELDEAHITTLAVHADHRRQGHATRLLAELLRAARARGARAATLEVRHHNFAAQRLYAGFQFRPVGIRPRYYEGKDDALIMWAHDIDEAEYERLLDARAAVGRRVTVAAHGDR